MSLITAKAAHRKAAEQAQAVVDDEALTVSEKAAALDKIEADIKAFEDEIALYRRIEGYASVSDAEETSDVAAPAETKHFARQLVENAEYKAAARMARIKGRFDATVELKSAGTPMITQIAPGALPEQQSGYVALPQREMQVVELFSQATTGAAVINYVVESAFTNNAAAVAAGGKKPLSEFKLTATSEQVGKIAHVMKVNDESLDDIDYIESMIRERLAYGLALEEERQALYGTGYPGLKGLTTRTEGFTTAPTTTLSLAETDATKWFNAVYASITAVRRKALVTPDAIVLSAAAWDKMTTAQDKNGQYYAGGPFMGAYGGGAFTNVSSIWGTRAVVAAALTSDTIIAGNFRVGGQYVTRKGLTIATTNSNEDDFINDLVAFRGEKRAALKLERPSAFCQIAVTA